MARPGPALFELIRDPATGARTTAVQPPGAGNAESPVVATRPPERPKAFPETPKPRIRLMPPSAPPVETPTPEPKPVAKEAPVAPLPPPPKPAAPRAGVKFQWRKPVTITTSGVLLAAAGVIVVVILGWVGIYTLGFKDGQTKTLKDKGLSGGIVSDPLKAEQIPVNGGLVSPEPAIRQASNVKPVGKQAPTPPSAPAAPVENPGTTAGASEIGPGLNYCIAAARLDKDAAEKAAAFLKENGVGAAAVQVVEGQWSGAKNAGSWMVVVLKGITGKEYGARGPARVEIESQLTRLGQVYKSKGHVDFGQFGWDKRK